jgi:hypothetical protein
VAAFFPASHGVRAAGLQQFVTLAGVRFVTRLGNRGSGDGRCSCAEQVALRADVDRIFLELHPSNVLLDSPCNGMAKLVVPGRAQESPVPSS